MGEELGVGAVRVRADDGGRPLADDVAALFDGVLAALDPPDADDVTLMGLARL